MLPGLTIRNLGRELVAGLTLFAIAVPLNLGYAQIAGLPPAAGLTAMVVPVIVYALIVSSRQMVASPDAAASALVASSIGGLAVAGAAGYAAMAMAQALLCGVFFVLAGVFRLGFLANFLSKPILTGFVGGLALDVLASQVAKMLGIKLEAGSEFVEKIAQLATGLGGTNLWSLAIALACALLLILGRRVSPAIPWALIALIAATLAVQGFGLASQGVAVLGKIEGGGVTLGWPDLALGEWLALVPSALALTLVTIAEGLLVSRAYAERRGYVVQPNRDLLAFGAANVAAGVTGGFAVGASTSRTAAMDQAGSRTQLPSIVAALGTLAMLLWGTGLLANIPSPAIGAIIAVAIIPLLGLSEIASYWRHDRLECLIALVCFLVTLFVGAIPGILVSFVLSLVYLARRASQPVIETADLGDPASFELIEPEPREPAPGVIVVRAAGPIFFANAADVDEVVKHAVNQAVEPTRHLVFDLVAVTDVDVSAAETLGATSRWLSERGVTQSFARARPELRARLERLGVTGVPHCETVHEAVRLAQPTGDTHE